VKKSTGQDIAEKKGGRQVKSSHICYDKAEDSLEARVAAYLISKKGEKSLGVFAAELGIPKMTLSRYLDAEISMSLSMLDKIAKALGVKPTSILAPPKK